MEQGPEKPKSYLDKARGIPAIAKARIEQELAETNNGWPACVGSIVFAMDAFLSGPGVKAELGEKRYELVMGKIETLQFRVDELMQEYPERDAVVPESVKEEIYQMIESFGKVL